MRFRGAFVCLYLITVLIAVGCGVISNIDFKKSVIDNQKFIAAAEAAGFSVKDETELYANVRGLNSALLASSSDGSMVCQFYVFDDTYTANSEFDIFKKTLDNTYVSSVNSSLAGDNFSIYKLTGRTDYHHLCAVDNTLLYGRSPNEEMEMVREFVVGVGYN
ncbi:hypothetical protein [Oribacterium sp. P6A1]|uniref:hypothetical protein n=1 Tax=Oribacterium sp. P6A1 TaxID=1410612 RepID=UPI00055EC6CB|nr:hypothetical protein [Oribacterium sp. P6A1]